MTAAPGSGVQPEEPRPGRLRRLRALLLILPGLLCLLGLVDPSLQPNDLWDRYTCVLSLRVAEVDGGTGTADLRIEAVHKGAITATRLTLATADPALHEVMEELFEPGRLLVAFVGSRRRGGELDLLLYPGEGRWQVGRIAAAEAGDRWEWTQDLDPNQPGSMYGTYNGPPERLREMTVDLAAGRYFFPARSFDRFAEERVVASLPAPLRGVGIHDLDGDGVNDLIATGGAGCRVLLQRERLRFVDASADLGLDAQPAASVAVADADGDGLPDLLIDDRLWRQRRDGAIRFIPVALPDSGPMVKSSTFVDLDRDGHPEVLISRARGGLSLLRRSGADSAWQEVGAAAGLRSGDLAEGDGFVVAGDWNGDGRPDLWYGIGSGVVLQQDADGRFVRGPCPEVDLRTHGRQEGLTGGASVAALWSTDGLDLALPSEESMNVLAGVDGGMVNVTTLGNELTEGSFGLLGVLAEDLNMDGRPDLYAGSTGRLAGSYYVNRGYGSFMMPEKYRADIFPGAAHRSGVWGTAAGDVDGDGANDLLLGGIDGTLALLLNGTLAQRVPDEAATLQQRVLAGTRLVTVDAGHGRGVVGATLRILAEDGRVLLRRGLGGSAGVGSAGPAIIALAVREAGRHRLRIDYADGERREWPLDCTAPEPRLRITAHREDQP